MFEGGGGGYEFSHFCFCCRAYSVTEGREFFYRFIANGHKVQELLRSLLVGGGGGGGVGRGLIEEVVVEGVGG